VSVRQRQEVQILLRALTYDAAKTGGELHLR
jgi:hypothetical protein